MPKSAGWMTSIPSSGGTWLNTSCVRHGAAPSPVACETVAMEAVSQMVLGEMRGRGYARRMPRAGGARSGLAALAVVSAAWLPLGIATLEP